MTHSRQPCVPISPLFVSQFRVDEASPFTRYLNRLEVEVAGENYEELKTLELLADPGDDFFAGCLELTEVLLSTSQNIYNCDLLKKQGIRVYMDVPRYQVYYRSAGRCIRFVPTWRERVLERFCHEVPLVDGSWRDCSHVLPGFQARFLADCGGGVLLLNRSGAPVELPILTVSHGPYDPHTLDVALYYLRNGKARAALVNLGFSGREPLTDRNLERLKQWGVPLNPSNIDIIYPYIDERGHPNCYKHERGLCDYLDLLGAPHPDLIIDIHGYVGTHAEDERVLVGMGGQPPYPTLSELGSVKQRDAVLHLQPKPCFRDGLAMIRDLSPEIYVQLCLAKEHCCHFTLLGGLQLIGRSFNPADEIVSMLEGEERSMLKREQIRWLPSAGANALQRQQACLLQRKALCIHVEIPTGIRRQLANRLREQAFEASFEASGL